jgi:Tfp pilus assembly protein PilF
MNFSFCIKIVALALLCNGVSFHSRAQDSLSRKAKADALYYDAVKARMLGDDKQSEALLLQVIREQPNDGAPYYDLSKIAIAQNKPDKASEYINKAIALDGKNKWYREQAANILIMRNDYAAAGDAFTALAKEEQYNEEYLLKSALLYQRANKYKEALAQLGQLEKKNGVDDDILMQQQQIYLKMNDVPGAAAVIQKLISRNPAEARYYSLLAELYSNNKQPDKAKEVYTQMQERFPNDPSLQLSLAGQSLKKGDTAAYRDYVQKAITNKELDAETQLGLLIPYLQESFIDSQQRKNLLVLVAQVVAQHPENVKVLEVYGEVLRLSGQPQMAVAQYKKIIAQKPGLFEPWQQLLYSYTDRKDADSLIFYSDKAARLFPNQAVVHYLKGIGHMNKKENAAAIKSINRAIDLQPEDNPEALSEMYSTLGEVYNTMKDYKQSDSAFEHAMRLNDKNATLLNNYAYYLSERNQRLADAERMSKKSLEIRPGEGTFLDTYGWILYRQGKYEEARKYIQQAIDAAKGEGDATLWEHMGAVQFKLGNAAKAVEAWQVAKQKGSESPQLDKMIADRKLYE